MGNIFQSCAQSHDLRIWLCQLWAQTGLNTHLCELRVHFQMWSLPAPKCGGPHIVVISCTQMWCTTRPCKHLNATPRCRVVASAAPRCGRLRGCVGCTRRCGFHSLCHTWGCREKFGLHMVKQHTAWEIFPHLAPRVTNCVSGYVN